MDFKSEGLVVLEVGEELSGVSILWYPDIGIDTGVPGHSREILVLLVGNVLIATGIPVLLVQPEVDDEDDGLPLTKTNEEVVGFDVMVDERFCVDIFKAAKDLSGKHEDGFKMEAPLPLLFLPPDRWWVMWWWRVVVGRC